MATANGVRNSASSATKKKGPAFVSGRHKAVRSSEVDRRVHPALHFIREKDLAEVRKIQATFHDQKRTATTYIWSAVAIVLTIRMVFPIPALPIFTLIAFAACLCWAKYRALCKCPACSVSLVPGANTWRTPVTGFSSLSCPRCNVELALPASHKRQRHYF